jgi:sporulation protein YlmC with PRC-barrel domain
MDSKGVGMNAQALTGMAVVTVTEGTKLGSVAQPLLDLTARRVAALRVAGDAGAFILPFDRIAHIGDDAITVESSAATQTPSTGGAADGLVDLRALGKLKVVDSEGTLLGKVSRVEFDPASGEITQLAAHKGGVLGMGGATTPIDARAIVQVGPALLTVNMEAAVLATAP